jgi:tetratricopeptide (TPR) repeat protein
MLKKYSLFLILMLSVPLAFAQQFKPVFDRYVDFNLERLTGDNATALDMGLTILDSVNDLPEKSRISFYNSMGKLYENNEQPERAIPYYEKVTAAVPNYYVAHRALGYIFVDSANHVYARLQTIKHVDKSYAQLKTDYTILAKKVIAHLEIAQACDPSDDTLVIIKTFYQNIGDIAGLDTLDDRLKAISKNCLDILVE